MSSRLLKNEICSIQRHCIQKTVFLSIISLTVVQQLQLLNFWKTVSKIFQQQPHKFLQIHDIIHIIVNKFMTLMMQDTQLLQMVHAAIYIKKKNLFSKLILGYMTFDDDSL